MISIWGNTSAYFERFQSRPSVTTVRGPAEDLGWLHCRQDLPQIHNIMHLLTSPFTRASSRPDQLFSPALEKEGWNADLASICTALSRPAFRLLHRSPWSTSAQASHLTTADMAEIWAFLVAVSSRVLNVGRSRKPTVNPAVRSSPYHVCFSQYLRRNIWLATNLVYCGGVGYTGR
jgi:hypothetical protein